MTSTDPGRLEAVRAAGLRRDYGFNGRRRYATAEEAAAFDDGLRRSMAAAPIVETKYAVMRPPVTLDGLRALVAAGAALLECRRCGTIAEAATAECPRCWSTGLVALDAARLDDEHPWRGCDGCGYGFLLDDALGSGGEPGAYLCPRCGRVT